MGQATWGNTRSVVVPGTVPAVENFCLLSGNGQDACDYEGDCPDQIEVEPCLAQYADTKFREHHPSRRRGHDEVPGAMYQCCGRGRRGIRRGCCTAAWQLAP